MGATLNPVVTLYLVRHAQQDWDRVTPDAEWPLTEEGREQAVALIARLGRIGPRSLWCSETERTRQTIRPFAVHAGLPVNEERDLGERRLTWPLPPMDEMKEHYRRGWEDLDYVLPDGESNRQAQTRFMAALNRIAQRESGLGAGRSVVVCAHGNVIALAEHAATGSFGDTHLGYCDGRVLELGEDGWVFRGELPG